MEFPYPVRGLDMLDRLSRDKKAKRLFASVLLPGVLCVAAGVVFASSHREAPGVSHAPQVDGTDFYMFRSYEPGREGFVTLLANYNPLQTPAGGPNFYPLDTSAVYDIHITNDGDAVEDLTFRFRFINSNPRIAVRIGPENDQQSIPTSLSHVFSYGINNDGLINETFLNVYRGFHLQVIRGGLDDPNRTIGYATNAETGYALFRWPFDYAGPKSAADYAQYAQAFIHDIKVPGCSGAGRVFVGQRRDPFAVNLGAIFDLININPVGEPDSAISDLANRNITSLSLEVPTDCLTQGGNGIIGGWTSSRMQRERRLRDDPDFNEPAENSGPFLSVSRLGMPLVNELVIGLSAKNQFNASEPRNDSQFLDYVTNPTLPALLEIVFGNQGVQAPKKFPRNDLVAAFLTGIDGLNRDGSVGEMLRLNTAINPVAPGLQNRLGVIGGDNAGFPNGRRPGDDVVDISLRAAMGALCHAFPGMFDCGPADAPSGQLPFTDGVFVDATSFDDEFPYLKTPAAGGQ